MEKKVENTGQREIRDTPGPKHAGYENYSAELATPRWRRGKRMVWGGDGAVKGSRRTLNPSQGRKQVLDRVEAALSWRNE